MTNDLTVVITSKEPQWLPENADDPNSEEKFEDTNSKEDYYGNIKHLCETWFNSSGGLNTIIFEYWRFIRWKTIIVIEILCSQQYEVCSNYIIMPHLNSAID